MSNDPQRQLNRFLAVSGIGMIQTANDVGLDNADIDTREKCEITMEDVIQRNDSRDCRGQDLIDQNLRTRAVRFNLNYTEVTPQILARWASLYFGASASPTGTPANEVQTVTRSGTVSGGTFTLSLTLEGRTVTTKPIAWNASNTDIQDALTAARMVFIQPGDVAITGSWATAITLTFPNTGRLGRANLALVVADITLLTGTSPALVVASSTNGAQNFHALTRSTGNEKARTSVIVGWDTVTDRVEKYVGFVVESFNPTMTRRQNVSLTVSLVGPWEPEIVTDYTIPECVNITPLLTDDCRVVVDGNYETSDVNTFAATLNDNVATDEASAFGFDSMDIQDLERGDTPAYSITTAIFAKETDNVYLLGFNERTEDPVPVIGHFGLPGDRFSILAPKSKVKFQGTRMSFVGSLRKSVIQLDLTPFKDGANAPVKAEAYLSQSTAFLTT